MCPRRGNDPASGHPRAHQPPLGRGTSPPAWDGRLDAPGQRRRHLPSSAWTRRREVKHGKSGGSVGTTDQGKGKGRSGVRPMGTVAYRGKGQGKGKGRGKGRLGQGGRGRSKGGEKLMGTTADGGKGSKGRAANGDRPVGAASCRRDHLTHGVMPKPPPPPPAPQSARRPRGLRRPPPPAVRAFCLAAACRRGGSSVGVGLVGAALWSFMVMAVIGGFWPKVVHPRDVLARLTTAGGGGGSPDGMSHKGGGGGITVSHYM